jgi:hypothetical protein
MSGSPFEGEAVLCAGVAEFPFNPPTTKVKIIPLNTSALFQMSCASDSAPRGRVQQSLRQQTFAGGAEASDRTVRIANFEIE